MISSNYIASKIKTAAVITFVAFPNRLKQQHQYTRGIKQHFTRFPEPARWPHQLVSLRSTSVFLATTIISHYCLLLATEVAFCRGATCSVRHQYQPNIGLLHHPPGTPVRGQFLMYIRALRATLNQADQSFNSVSLYNQLAICHS